MSDDGYPTEEELAKIKAWGLGDYADLMAFVRTIWTYADCGYWTETVTPKGRPLYSISTGGWSGNEDIIGALQANWAFWSLTWLSSRRGGHYEFEPMFAAATPVAAGPAPLLEEGAARPNGDGR